MFRNPSMDEVNRLENTNNYINADGKEIGITDLELAIETATVTDIKGEYAAVTPKEAPSVLSWQNLCVSTKPKNGKPSKVLLNKISGSITGGLWGIMGASGSGKTTFLSTLSLRLDTHRMQTTGDIRLNGKEYAKHILKSMSGYVMQDDLLCAFFTVQETLEYAAALRMEAGTPYHERKARCDEVLQLLGIDYCRDVIIGDTRNKGISGGERKRVCVAMELLTRPKLLFLDEPTSGLDSTTALSVMQTLKDLAERGECTVVCTIHQPQTKIYNLLDNLLLMKKGEIVFQGAAARADAFFAAQGFPCPDKMNPADHLLDVVTVATHDHKDAANVKRLEVPINLDFGLDKNDFKLRAVQPWAWQFCVLFHRNLMEKVRRWDIFAMNIFITCVVATFIGMGAWNKINHDQSGVSNKIRNAILFFCVIHQGVVSSLQGTYSFPLERALMLRERAAGSYYVSSYFLSKTTVDTLFQMLPPIIFTCFVYPMCGLNLEYPYKFFIFMFFNMLLSICATSLSNMMSCICVSIEMSTVVLACAMEITRLYSAFFISPLQLDADPANKWKFFDRISYMKYGYIGLVNNEYIHLRLHCLPSQLVAGKCPVTNGQQIMESFGYQRYSISYLAGCMVAYFIICRIAAYLALRFIKI